MIAAGDPKMLRQEATDPVVHSFLTRGGSLPAGTAAAGGDGC